MSRVVNRPVRVVVDALGRPRAVRWDRRWYEVTDVHEEWIYREPWWERSLFPDVPCRFPQRHFYRVALSDGGVIELAYRDPEGDWRLYRIYD